MNTPMTLEYTVHFERVDKGARKEVRGAIYHDFLHFCARVLAKRRYRSFSGSSCSKSRLNVAGIRANMSTKTDVLL
jgi:hypothetical protein